MCSRTTRLLSLALVSLLAPNVLAQVRIAHISDIHLHNSSAPNARPRLVAIVESINEKLPDAVIVSGDMAEDDAGGAEVRQILAGVTVPVFYVPGNHDTNGADIARYRSLFGPDYYKVEVKNIAIFALNSQLLGNFNNLQAPTPPPMDPVAQAEGDLMLQWLGQQTVRPGQIALAFQHVPLYFSDRMPERRPYWVINEPYFSRELAEFRRLGIRHLFVGHWHMRNTDDGPESEADGEDVDDNEDMTQHVAPSVAFPLFRSHPGYSLHTISASGQVTTELVAPTTDLTLKMSAPAKIALGDNFTYTLSVKNLGPRKASGVVLTNTLPGGQLFVSASSSQGSCSGSNQLVCDVGLMAPRAEANAKITVQAQAAGEITNTATVSANQYDSNEVNNRATLATVVENKDFQVQITPPSATLGPGGSATYSVSVIPTSAGFFRLVVLRCSGLPAPATCRLNPAEVVPGNQVKTAVLSVSGVNLAAAARPSNFNFAAVLFPLLLVAGATFTYRRKLRRTLLQGALLLLVLGCGSEARDEDRPSTTALTVTVSGTSGSLGRSATAILVVK